MEKGTPSVARAVSCRSSEPAATGRPVPPRASKIPLLARSQGLYLLLSGLWPLVHYRSFETVTGPKADPWLVRTVAGLAATMGYVQLRTDASEEGTSTARRIGMGAALTFGTIGVVYGGSGRISRIYLLESAVEALWILAWRSHSSRSGGSAGPARTKAGRGSQDRLSTSTTVS